MKPLHHRNQGLPMKPGRLGTMTHDYERHGTTTLFAASTCSRARDGQCMQRHGTGSSSAR